ncbi:MAG TPA: secondary thiamine-phosphate synthase enzyme YjbQ [Gammaproteobacteria bacterium]|nr:secondary thiamine-phosphate synthase enzyme YjbQ [Gammaproteobacteria bacterium]
MIHQTTLSFDTGGRGSLDVTADVRRAVKDSGVTTGLCSVFIHHTSASLMLCENADPQVRADLDAFMARLAPDGDPLFKHTAEGPDDMPSHVRSVLTDSSLTMPVREGDLDLGVWQGVYIWEHRHRNHSRRITVTIYGD